MSRSNIVFGGQTGMEHADRVEFAAGLVRIVALHDDETAAHLRATAVLARQIAQCLHVTAELTATIELAALVHDIGKIQVRREVLCKRDALSAAEWDEMRVHAESGARVLDDVPSLAHLAPIVRAHHERLDGRGYPDRLRGAEIPFEARVVAVADAFHALTTDRPYRRAVAASSALRVLAEAAGPQFDTEIVGVVFELFGRPEANRLSA